MRATEPKRDWSRYARALDMHLDGARLKEIAFELGVTRERVRWMIADAKARLAYRVFNHQPFILPSQLHARELRRREWERIEREWRQRL